MQKMKFTTLFRCGCASGDNGSSGYFLEDKMESLKLQKLCGYIIYIKSVIATILASILFGSGIYYCTSLSRQKEDINDMGEKAIVTCKNLIESLAGFSYIIIAIVIISLALLYLFHSRKLIYANNYQKKLIVISLVVESVCAYAFSEYFISSIFMGLRWELLYILTMVPVFIAQSFFTIYLLAKSLEKHKKEVKA